jgi:hypothetical protein
MFTNQQSVGRSNLLKSSNPHPQLAPGLHSYLSLSTAATACAHSAEHLTAVSIPSAEVQLRGTFPPPPSCHSPIYLRCRCTVVPLCTAQLSGFKLPRPPAAEICLPPVQSSLMTHTDTPHTLASPRSPRACAVVSLASLQALLLHWHCW